MSSTINAIKGRILEIVVETILKACGYIDVNIDGIFVFKSSQNMIWINGKGAKHNADVLLEPPFQMPFIFPTRLVVECKNYKGPLDLKILRNILGLRDDLNDFEVLSYCHLSMRTNTKRIKCAIENYQRYNYQVAIASMSGFTKDAIEFAFHHKIPLIDFNAVFPKSKTQLSNINAYSDKKSEDVLEYLKKHKLTERMNFTKHGFTGSLKIDEIDPINDELNMIAIELSEVSKKLAVGVVGTGDVILLKSNKDSTYSLLSFIEMNKISGNECSIHYKKEDIGQWYISINNKGDETRLYFAMPGDFMELWSYSRFSEYGAIELKEKYFSKVSIYATYEDRLIALNLSINPEWIDINKDSINKGNTVT